jgi:hypothetical protein
MQDLRHLDASACKPNTMRTAPEPPVPTDEKRESCQPVKNTYVELKWQLDYALALRLAILPENSAKPGQLLITCKRY